MSACDETRALLDLWLDGEQSGATQAELDEHLAACPECAGMFERFGRLVGNLNELSRAADRSAGAPGARRAIPSLRRQRSWRMAAAIVLVAGIAWLSVRWLRSDPSRSQQPVVVQRSEPAMPKRVGPSVQSDGEQEPVQVAMADGGRYLLTPVASRHKNIHIVWAYETTRLPESAAASAPDAPTP